LPFMHWQSNNRPFSANPPAMRQAGSCACPWQRCRAIMCLSSP
jgi:hypothetical protein